MIKYEYSLSEEIARWSLEIFLRENPKLGWWVAFTNPTAGPWKKIIAKDNKGRFIEIHRFEREEERPDLVLVNDQLQTILIVEAKETLKDLVDDGQMIKSLRVIKALSTILRNIDQDVWKQRRKYLIVPSFLWSTESSESLEAENQTLLNSFEKNRKSIVTGSPINIVVFRSSNQKLDLGFFSGKTKLDTLMPRS